MRKFLLDMRKDFLIMSNFYLVEILGEQNSLTIVTSKKILKMSNYDLILSIFFSKWESGLYSVLDWSVKNQFLIIFDVLANDTSLCSSLGWGTKFCNHEKLYLFNRKFQFIYWQALWMKPFICNVQPKD